MWVFRILHLPMDRPHRLVRERDWLDLGQRMVCRPRYRRRRGRMVERSVHCIGLMETKGNDQHTRSMSLSTPPVKGGPIMPAPFLLLPVRVSSLIAPASCFALPLAIPLSAAPADALPETGESYDRPAPWPSLRLKPLPTMLPGSDPPLAIRPSHSAPEPESCPPAPNSGGAPLPYGTRPYRSSTKLGGLCELAACAE